ncbi:MAG: phage BR0599 family protein [Steroidobacteraceae bacterium]
MTYDAAETGLQTGAPVELYEFTHGTTVYRYTSADTDQVFAGNTYAAVPLSRSTIEATQEIARGALNLTCARTLPVLQLFNPLPPSEVIGVVVRRYHRGVSGSAVIWMGRVLNIGLDGLQASIRCESVYSSIKRPGLRRLYQKQCPHVLYSEQCGVDRSAFKISRAVTLINGLQITLADMGAIASGYLSGGYVEWPTGGGTFQRRAIREQIGAVLTLNFRPQGLAVGTIVDAYPGCDHSLATCISKFGNGLNNGGMPYIPTKNPFDGSPIF